MGIFGIAKRGFGMLKKSKKGIDPKKRLQTFKKASEKQKVKSSINKINTLDDIIKKKNLKKLMTQF